MTTLVPLKLTKAEEVIWENPRPCSVLYCRPIQLLFIKESIVLVQEQLAKMEHEISSLKVTQYDNNEINHSLVMTMIDGKVAPFFQMPNLQQLVTCAWQNLPILMTWRQFRKDKCKPICTNLDYLPCTLESIVWNAYFIFHTD